MTDELAGVERGLRAAAAHVEAITGEPRLRALHGEALDGERERWAADRLARHETAAREARKRRHRKQQVIRRPDPPTPSMSASDPTRGIGR